MIHFSSLSTCLLRIPSEYSDLCLLTGANEIEPVQRLTHVLTIQRFLREMSGTEYSPAFRLFQAFLEQREVERERTERINASFYHKAQRLLVSSHIPKREQALLDDWYTALWKGIRREIELNISIGTQILFKKENVLLDDFLQYFLNLLSIGSFVGSDRLEEQLAYHCFMAAEL